MADHFGYINNRSIPYPNREYVESFTGLVGGVNTFDQMFNLKSSEAAMMKNLSWRAGVLGCRRGQVQKAAEGELYVLPETTQGDNKPITYVACAQFLFHGWLIVQGDAEGAIQPNAMFAVKIEENGEPDEHPIGTVLPLNVTTAVRVKDPGLFFRYREVVYFKGKGAYQSFGWSSDNDTVYGISFRPFIPVLQIDTNPTTGAGNFFQRINRLTTQVKVGYLAPANQLTYQLPVHPIKASSIVYAWVGDPKNEDASDVSGDRLIDNTVDYTNGVVTLDEAQAEGASVVIQFNIDDPDSLSTILDSTAAIVFGGTQELCVVVGGPSGQPNAYFWSGNNGVVMDPTYFPDNQYNLAGDNDEPITAFGRQQNMLTVFQPNATGRAVFSTETINGLVQVTMDYTRINAEIGCDLPGSLQLVENNLVWANRKYGVCRLKDSSAAYENNITVLSRKINSGRFDYAGLLNDIAAHDSADVRSTDTGTRYILMVGDNAYEWNYELSSHEEPSWFLHDGILGVGFVPLANDVLYEVTEDGRIATFEDGVFSDFGEAIDKLYRFPPRNFGNYDRLKNIMSCILSTRADTDQNTTLTYICDYTHRVDPTNLVVIATTEESGRPFASVFRRKPGYHNLRHLQMILSNDEVGKDLSIIEAHIYYTLRGRQR